MRKQYDFSKAKRGAVVKAPKGKTRITIRLDDEILDWFKEQANAAGGGNYQSMINDALKDFIATRSEPLEAVVRRVVREELKKVNEPKRGRAA
jgi:metal-responsive CopG/Arc/MetJ family transcriptional regulator